MSAPRPEPFLKWAGGKRQLLPQLLERVPVSFNRYREPFLGGGALFFELVAQGRIKSDRLDPNEGATLSDSNEELVDCYLAVRDCIEQVIEALRKHRNDEAYFYEVRSQAPRELALHERAARTIFLNRTCFNGLFRVNREGRFNVPFGRYKNPRICDEEGLRAASRALQSATIICQDFKHALSLARPGDFVYCDPPYLPQDTHAPQDHTQATTTQPTGQGRKRAGNFAQYQAEGFTEARQVELATSLKELARNGSHVLASNAGSTRARELYCDFDVSLIETRRNITRNGEDRAKKAPELLVYLGPSAGAP